MATRAFAKTLEKIQRQTLNPLTATIKALLLEDKATPAYTYDPATEFLSTGGSSDIVDDEVLVADVASYVRVAVPNFDIVFENGVLKYKSDSIVFPGLESGVTIEAGLLYFELGADTANVPLFLVDPTDAPTGNADFTLIPPSSGNGWMHITFPTS